MSALVFLNLRRRETLEGKQSAAREVLAQGVGAGPTQQAEGVFSYGLSSACAHYLDIALSEKADELNTWASQRGKRITSTTILDKHPETLRLEQGSIMRTPDDSVAVVLPLSATAVQVEGKAASSEEPATTTTRATWEPEAAMLVAAGQAFSVVEGSAHLVYVVVRMQSA
ncbi:hypothetical protein ISF_06106 [Cordyceps fumosorosea ARSEF 2679]|uniref:Mannose-6-phosphate isomerase n=1 Tax=Cordyceps fumosorosea (strain ARSEF 2679) TaxID=1081104 RepID=A0A167SZM8_CORFA|nr:hypothetical protein ISF_06106 [Cordyceps fumosorosea ARSEF 2679]OAA60095.1 hypothetical protein ISF_06106 [Cordyceps fumosorosea ARSEF 2679]